MYLFFFFSVQISSLENKAFTNARLALLFWVFKWKCSGILLQCVCRNSHQICCVVYFWKERQFLLLYIFIIDLHLDRSYDHLHFLFVQSNKIIKWLCITFFIFLLAFLPIDEHILHKKYCFVNLVFMNGWCSSANW